MICFTFHRLSWIFPSKSSLEAHESLRNGKANGREVTCESSLIMPAAASVSDGLKNKVWSKMATDEVTILVRNDPLIIQFGERLYQKHGHRNICMNLLLKR